MVSLSVGQSDQLRARWEAFRKIGNMAKDHRAFTDSRDARPHRMLSDSLPLWSDISRAVQWVIRVSR
ncbi:unnamed protein product [Boreogadus saida]